MRGEMSTEAAGIFWVGHECEKGNYSTCYIMRCLLGSWARCSLNTKYLFSFVFFFLFVFKISTSLFDFV